MPITALESQRIAYPSPVRTPLLREGALWLKPEGSQLGGSVKYRMVVAKVKAAREAGAVASRILTEVTSGSTGVALAYLGRRLGLPTEVHAYDATAPDKVRKIREYGAHLILYPNDTPIGEMFSAVGRAVAAGTHWHLNQYDRRTTPPAYADFAGEIVEQIRALGGPLPALFACPVGTGGLIQGVGRALREAFPGIGVVAVEPEPGASIDGMRNTEKMHMGEKDPYDLRFPDERVTVPASRGPASVAGFQLGESATAVVEWVRSVGRSDVLVVAPD